MVWAYMEGKKEIEVVNSLIIKVDRLFPSISKRVGLHHSFMVEKFL